VPESRLVLAIALVAFVAARPRSALAQPAASLGDTTRQYVTVGEPVVALTHVTIIDGTGAAPKADQTIVIRGGKIAQVGPAASVAAPAGARVMSLTGQTVIPGLVGMHDHLFYTAAGGREMALSFSAPRLYLASGVTTIRTTGATEPYGDINTKHSVDLGRSPGPHIIITSPYITGPAGGTSNMAVLASPDQARQFVDYWVGEGVQWIKSYTDIRRAELKAVIDEAHRRGIKVTGHLCSVSYREAVELGIDNLEHGFFTATDFDPTKQPDVCPAGSFTRVAATNPNSDVGRSVIQTMISHKVPMTSTLAVLEPFFPNRPVTDQRTLDAMAPEVRQAYLRMRAHIDSAGSQWPFTPDMLKNAMTFEKEFVDAGGVLGVGVDPTGIGGALPGFGDQRNYELLIEAGFTPSQVIEFMSANGAKILGHYDEFGSIESGKRADLVVLDGNLAADPSTIRKVTTVFKDGVGYDSPKLIASVAGHVGIN
jgi:imidazolonepropionase-like amidohydrolase